MTTNKKQEYKPTESKYKGDAKEMYITYDIEQETRGENKALYPKVKRVYIPGNVKDYEVGKTEKQSGKEVRGLTVNYEQGREGYHREGFTAERDGSEYEVEATDVSSTKQEFTKVVEVPEEAKNIKFYEDKEDLPERYESALQNVK